MTSAVGGPARTQLSLVDLPRLGHGQLLFEQPPIGWDLVAGQLRAREGEPAELVVEPRRLHFFDPESGLAIFGDEG